MIIKKVTYSKDGKPNNIFFEGGSNVYCLSGATAPDWDDMIVNYWIDKQVELEITRSDKILGVWEKDVEDPYIITFILKDPLMQLGKYKHFKGGIYNLKAIAENSETGEDMCIYKDETGKYWARPLSMWNEKVNGRQRFTKI